MSLEVAAISISSISLIVAVLGCWNNWREIKHQKTKFKEGMRWNEYQETVYDPLLVEIKKLRQIARGVREVANSELLQVDPQFRLAGLATQLNEITIVCRDADHHPSTVEANWVKFSEDGAEKIHEVIATSQCSSKGAIDVGELDEVIRQYVAGLTDRLRTQREDMTLSDSK